MKFYSFLKLWLKNKMKNKKKNFFQIYKLKNLKKIFENKRKASFLSNILIHLVYICLITTGIAKKLK